MIHIWGISEDNGLVVKDWEAGAIAVLAVRVEDIVIEFVENTPPREENVGQSKGLESCCSFDEH